MMVEKIHCDLLEIFGPDWANLSPEMIDCIINTIDTMEQLFGDEPNLNGFVGTRRFENIVGGYFAIQYREEEFHYTKRKELQILPNTPFVRLFFVLFAKTGKLLLQNTKFVGIPLNMVMAVNYFRKALNQVLEDCQIMGSFNIDLAPEAASESEFIKEFERSTRVVRIEILNPNPSLIPEDFTYYNPERPRNEIIRGSHQHDYTHLKRVDLEANDSGNIKETHLRDLIYAGNPQLMKYFVGLDDFILRRDVRRKFEFHIDMDSEIISESQLHLVIDKLRRERAIFLDTPTPIPPEPSTKQLRLFDYYHDSDEANDDEE